MIIAVDFDGTIVEHAFPAIGEPMPGAFEWLKRWKAAGATLILWTVRDVGEQADYLTPAVEFCRRNGVEFDYVNRSPLILSTSPKAYYDLLVDDRAFGCSLTLAPSGTTKGCNWAEVGPAVLEAINAA